MKKKEFVKKILVGALSVTTAASIMPVSALAVTADEVAADGVYTGSATVESDDPYDADANPWGWPDYTVDVSLTVENGVFTDITVEYGNTFTSDSNSYFNRAVNGTSTVKGIVSLEGQPATEDTVNSYDIDTVTNATLTAEAVKTAALDAIHSAEEAAEDAVEGEVYVLMNIPYAEFYAAELNNDVSVDAFTSATLQKSRTGSLVNGSYHVDPEGTDITGVTFPVKLGSGVTLEDLAEYTQITDESSVTIAVTNRGTTSETTYEGSDALFESASYSYYVLSEAPSYYKELTIDDDGTMHFGAMTGDTTPQVITEGVTPVFTTDTSYGDYELDFEGLTDLIGSDLAVYGVVISTEEGHDYGLRHMENIWRVYELSWCTGFTDSIHGCPTSSEHYESMMGETITSVTYYTENGIYEIPVDELVEGGIYVPVKFDYSVTVEDASVSSGQTTVEIEGLPDGFEPEYSVEGLENVAVNDGILSFDAESAENGSYTLVISDANGIYVDMSAEFELYADETPAVYDKNSEALVAADGVSEEEFADYISNITEVSVNGTSYSASGRGAVTIINSDGTINTEADVLAGGGSLVLRVFATGYQDVAFAYTDAYILMNIPYADFYEADLNNDIAVDTYTSATLNKSRTGSLVNGSYHVDPEGTDITGSIFPVSVQAGTDLSAYRQVTDDDSVTITVTNRGTTSETTYEGSDALFESDSYSYYVLSEVPSYYKALTVEDDGTLSFGAMAGDTEAEVITEGVTPVFTTDTTYGDYELDFEGLTDLIGSDLAVYGVVISTEEGHDYGLRHMENIWRVYELAWCTGFTDSIHGCPTSSEHYESMMGETITSVTYYTENGIYEIPVDELVEGGIYVPVKFDYSVTVEDALYSSGQTAVEIEGLPDDFDPVYSVEGLEDVTVSDGILSFAADSAQKGSYTLVISDASGVYADISAEFALYTDEIPVKYNEDGSAPALIMADGFDEADFADYISSITSVSVNGTDYSATGRGAVTIINEDGTIDTSADVFAEGDSFEITVTATGYLPYTLTYVPASADEPEDPSDTTENPSDTTEDPADTTEDPSGTTEDPADTTEDPSGTTEEPADTTEDPSGTTEEPSDTTEDPSQATGGTTASGTTTSGTTTSGTAASGSSSQTSGTSDAADTSDNSQVMVWIIVLGAAGCAVLATYRKKKIS